MSMICIFASKFITVVSKALYHLVKYTGIEAMIYKLCQFSKFEHQDQSRAFKFKKPRESGVSPPPRPKLHMFIDPIIVFILITTHLEALFKMLMSYHQTSDTEVKSSFQLSSIIAFEGHAAPITKYSSYNSHF